MTSATVHSSQGLHSAPPVRIFPSEAEQIEQLAARLRLLVGASAPLRVVRAPLRICPLGAHIDHQLGVVTGMTIDQAVLLVFAPAPNGKVHVESLNFGGATQFETRQAPPYQKDDWGNYVRGAVLALQQQHSLAYGMTGVVGGAMPIGGLSSSAAVTIAYLLALEALNDLAVGPEENVQFCRYTENQYIGLNNGILDQSVILFSRQDHLTRIDCQKVVVDRAPLPTGREGQPFEIAVVYSGVTHALVGTDYNNRVAECREAARTLLAFAGEEASTETRLRHVPAALFEAEGTRLAPPLQRRARHFFGEMQRVSDGVEAWRSGDLSKFGQLVTASGESSIQWYECGSPQLITLYETLRAAPGVYGTRFGGAGFRGSCIALIDPAARAEVADAVHRAYPQTHPEVADRYSIHFCRPDGPAQVLEGTL
jgi:galactokinase